MAAVAVDWWKLRMTNAARREGSVLICVEYLRLM